MAKPTGIQSIYKRDGRVVQFDAGKITEAIFRAFKAAGEFDRVHAETVCADVCGILAAMYRDGRVPSVEGVQDLVENRLIAHNHAEVAKRYILYREQHAQMREAKKLVDDALGMVDDYIEKKDWRIKENSNMSFSLQGLNNHLFSSISSRYWLRKIYPPEIGELHTSGDFHLHDLGLLAAYCCGWDLMDLLKRGFGGVSGKVESSAPKHFRTALGQIYNFFYTMQGESAGAQAFASFDTLLAPFIAYDGLAYADVKQAMQEFIFNMNIPTRVGFQTPFTNITLDLVPPATYRDQAVVIGGKEMDRTYAEFAPEMTMINRAFCEVMMKGDAKGRVFTFPIPTYNITRDFNWDDPELDILWEMTARYGVPYFSNYINSDMKPEDARSMCCRLRLDNRELWKRGGGLFGANPLTGSIGVVTINLPRIAYLAASEAQYFERLGYLMDRAADSLAIKREVLEGLTRGGLYPYSKHYLAQVHERFGRYWGNHFSTIGLVGMNEACLNFLGADITSPQGKDLAIRTLSFMRDRLIGYQEATGSMFNLEATPAEGTSFRLAKADKKKFPAIVSQGEKNPFYTNSTQLPVQYTDDLFLALEHQDELQTLYTGGTVLHGFLGERIDDIRACKLLVRRIAENFRLPYYTLTPTFTICPEHGYIRGEHFACPYDSPEEQASQSH
jgi:ribonucleoside-triphosphate reductase